MKGPLSTAARRTSRPLVRRLRTRVLTLAVALAALAVFAPAAMAAASTFIGGPIANDTPLYVANDHTVTAIRFTAAPSADAGTLAPNTTYYVKVRFSPQTTPQGSSNRGFTWNGTSGQWVQERDEWPSFPTVTTDASGNITQSPWLSVKVADETKAGTYYVLVSLSTGVAGSTVNGTETPAVTVLDMTATTGGGFWVHDGIATGQTGGKRADAVAGGLSTVWALQRTEPNLCDDDVNGVVDDEDYGAAGAAGDFKLAVPAGLAFDVRLQSIVWPAAAPSFTAATADVDLAYGATDQTAPTAPGGLVAVEGAGQVSLSWTAATDLGGSGLAGYVVYRWADPVPIGGATAYTSAPVAIGMTTEASYVDTTGVTGTPYHYLVRAVDSATNKGPRSATVTGSPKLACTATLTAVSPTVAWLGDAALTWQLTGAGGADILGATATLERSTDKAVTWTPAQDVTVAGSGAATVVATSDLSRRTWYRLAFAGDATYLAATSATVEVAPRVYLTRPTAPTAIGDDVRFTSTGTLKPRHTVGAKTIRIKCYKKVSGAWKLKQTVTARNANITGGTKYKATFALPSSGKWKLVAYHPDDMLHAATNSAARYVTVR